MIDFPDYNLDDSDWALASIDELKRRQLVILDIVGDYCSRNDLQYFMWYGSMIGAVRHHGYIPWDDDIDICMPIEDYQRFVAGFNGFSQKVEVLDRSLDSSFPFYFAKVRDTETVLIETIEGKPHNVGINIDLFRLDYCPDGRREQKNLFAAIDAINRRALPGTIDRSIDRGLIKNSILTIANRLIKRKTVAEYMNDLERVVVSSVSKPTEYYIEPRTPYRSYRAYPSRCFSNAIWLPFECLKVPIPVGYDELLTGIYGDYMTPPSYESQKSHHSFKAYVKNDGRK